MTVKKAGAGAPRTGWRSQEDELLFERVEQGRRCGMPLKAVFSDVAKRTGRQPNSVRNYYYARVRSGDPAICGAHCSAFVPFTQEEELQLLKTVLSEHAKGKSVRAITLELGGGDDKKMLRYQNKYRALIKNAPDRVRDALRELADEGTPAFDPYAASARPAREKVQGSDLVEVVSAVVNDLDKVEGLDVTAFFESLGALALAAGRAAPAEQGYAVEELTATCRAQQAELCAQRERFNSLLGLHRQLISVNRDFLALTGVTKMSALSGYIHELSQNVEDCEKLLREY